MSEKILTLHPQGKNGVRIDLWKYQAVRKAIATILAQSSCTFTELAEKVEAELGAQDLDSVPWYTVVVKQDLLARGVIEELPRTRPKQLRMSARENPT